MSRLSSGLQGDTVALLREARAAVEDVRLELGAGPPGARGQGRAPPVPLGPRLASLEGKLGVLEGALLGAARDSREASSSVTALARDSKSGQEALIGAVKGELRRAVSALASEESAAIARLDARLAVGWAGAGGPGLLGAVSHLAGRLLPLNALVSYLNAFHPNPNPFPILSPTDHPTSRLSRAPWRAWRWPSPRASAAWA
jgi:hypothetical protein